MTYYGRWTYKYEEAARQGAAGAIIIHETLHSLGLGENPPSPALPVKAPGPQKLALVTVWAI